MVSRPGARQGLDLGDLDRREHRWSSRPRSVLETVKTPCAEPVSPATCGVLADADVTGNLGVRRAVSRSEHDPGPEHLTVGAAGGVRTPGQDPTFLVGQDHDISTGWSHIHF